MVYIHRISGITHRLNIIVLSIKADIFNLVLISISRNCLGFLSKAHLQISPENIQVSASTYQHRQDWFLHAYRIASKYLKCILFLSLIQNKMIENTQLTFLMWLNKMEPSKIDYQFSELIRLEKIGQLKIYCLPQMWPHMTCCRNTLRNNFFNMWPLD